MFFLFRSELKDEVVTGDDIPHAVIERHVTPYHLYDAVSPCYACLRHVTPSDAV